MGGAPRRHARGEGRPRPRAHPGHAGAPAAAGVRLAVPDHDRNRARLRRAPRGRALRGVQTPLRDGARARLGRAPLPRRRDLAAPAWARGLLLPRPRAGVGHGPARAGLSAMPRRARVLAMIMAGGKGARLQPLTRERSKSAVPFGGRFRLVDFALSNFMNSELASIYVLVQYKSQSLIEHLRVAWRTSGQLPDSFVPVVPPQTRFGSGWYRGTAHAARQNRHLMDDASATVLALSAYNPISL